MRFNKGKMVMQLLHLMLIKTSKKISKIGYQSTEVSQDNNKNGIDSN